MIWAYATEITQKWIHTSYMTTPMLHTSTDESYLSLMKNDTKRNKMKQIKPLNHLWCHKRTEKKKISK
jgi:hypothetical protein